MPSSSLTSNKFAGKYEHTYYTPGFAFSNAFATRAFAGAITNSSVTQTQEGRALRICRLQLIMKCLKWTGPSDGLVVSEFLIRKTNFVRVAASNADVRSAVEDKREEGLPNLIVTRAHHPRENSFPVQMSKLRLSAQGSGHV
ncbi:hypothetical protein BaRGS_00018150 [Batillaria attramentaria]|uniref:Uncharacterized protein n=1 Tax=Batillaria attramentaria TaxID=370345 RepID=A0ABD0KTJ6_9CAEN